MKYGPITAAAQSTAGNELSTHGVDNKTKQTVHDEQNTVAGTAGHEPNTTAAQSTVVHELNTAAGTAGNEPNTTAAQSTVGHELNTAAGTAGTNYVRIVVDNTLLKSKVLK